ncbi:MAG: phospho-N-acetylmuramoyl-pentapeptide-transferase [Prevotellaceae bacterium]|jgi:phospho-N-acetylmuramoyl-pentapeptide-transferase|nr:phospho-N-acetylmuramoyl-pentapeptide-transferase [Prevotellaceae bacterium]
MLYYLFDYLHKNFDIAGTGLFHYVSFRALLTTILALLISSIFGNRFINLLKRKQRFETQRDATIDPFGVNKIGVPSMGGVIIITAIVVPCLLLGKLSNTYMILMLVATLWMGAVGFADDYIKIFRKNKEGLSGKYKLLAQAGLGLVVGLGLYYVPDAVMRENVEIQRNNGQRTEVVHSQKYIKSTQTTIPFVKENNLDYVDAFKWIKDSDWQRKMGWALFVFVTIFVVAAVSNGANLNDGMDGMAAGNSAIIGIALGILAYVSSHLELASYLNIMFIPGAEELVIFICAFVGALIGFLWYNAYPAQIFMGDTGSLSIGSIIAVFAIIIHKELLIPVLCGVFFVESLSVILQTQYFKFGKRKGKTQRMFKRAPIHDHFRTKDLIQGCTYVITAPRKVFHESKITTRFWIMSILLAALAIITLKIR